MIILGIESTCDETGVAVVENGTKVISNKIASSIAMQKKYKGVVPEIAAREQVRAIIPLISDSLSKVQLSSVDAIAVSYGPGLIGSLLVGVETAKALSLIYKIPLIAVNHLEGHFYSSLLESDRSFVLPAVGLIVSGGHTDLVYVERHGQCELLGSTLDDAAGEAFDKVARFLELEYPGGPEIEKHASEYNQHLAHPRGEHRSDLGHPGGDPLFPRPMIGDDNFDFSFSGLKTSVVNYVQKNHLPLSENNVQKVSYYFQQATVDVLVSKTIKAAKKMRARSIVIGGGVAANKYLLQELEKSSRESFKFYSPLKKYAVDNGAMIAAAAFYKNNFVDPLTLTADASLHF